jgi:hypothetical protein
MRRHRRIRKKSDIKVMGEYELTHHKSLKACNVKRTYPSKGSAKANASKTASEHGIQLYPYYCKCCRKWHLTKKR